MISATSKLLPQISGEITLIKVTHNTIVATVFFAKRKRGAAFQRGAAALTSIAWHLEIASWWNFSIRELYKHHICRIEFFKEHDAIITLHRWFSRSLCRHRAKLLGSFSCGTRARTHDILSFFCSRVFTGFVWINTKVCLRLFLLYNDTISWKVRTRRYHLNNVNRHIIFVLLLSSSSYRVSPRTLYLVILTLPRVLLQLILK